MATLKEQLAAEKEKLRKAQFLVEQSEASLERSGKEPSEGLLKARKEVTRLKASIADLTKKITSKDTEKLNETFTPEQKKSMQESAVKGALPFTDDKLTNELKVFLGPQFSPEAFATGGVGANILVYQGEKKGKATSPTGGTYTVKQDNAALVNDVISSYWTDKTIQKKVLSALIGAGNSNATQLDAFATWQSIVQQSAQLYNAGRGPKFTPMDILNMSLTKAGGAKPDVTTYLDVPKDMELKQILRSKLAPLLRMEPKDDDPTFQSFFNDIKALYQKGETVTTTVDPKTGKKIQKRTGGVTDAMVQAKIDKYYNENNQDFLEAKSLDATDYFSQWMRS
jgi:hypothetical protein